MTKQEMERVKRAVIRKYPIFASVALFNVSIEEDNRISTAAVWAKEDNNGKIVLGGIKYNSDFFDNLSFKQQVFVLAHETCHIAFKHFERSLEKPKRDIDSKYQKYCESVSDEKLRKMELIKLEKKYYNFWNIATDACINAFLKKDGLEMPNNIIDKKTGIPMNFVDIADGLYRRSEAIYDSIVKKDNEKNKEEQDNQGNKRTNQNEQDSLNNKSDNNQDALNDKGDNTRDGQDKKNRCDKGKNVSDSDEVDDFDIDDYQGIDSHEHWRGNSTVSKAKNDKQIDNKNNQDAAKKTKNESKSFLDRIKDFLGVGDKNQDNVGDKTSDKKTGETPNEVEKKSNDENQEQIDSMFNDETIVFRENTKIREESKKTSFSEALGNITKGTSIDDISFVKPVLSWKQLLIGSIEEEEEKWGYRRASRNMPNARIEDRIQDEKATTEIILDTSGSISEQILKSFLYQLLPLFRETEIKVGCFAGKFHGFTELKTIDQIKNFRPLRDSNGTNFEAAVKAFSCDNPSRRINKIVFTDGKLDYVASHRQQTKVDGIIWIVFGNKMDFKPLSGKVIKVNEVDLSKTIGFIDDDNFVFLKENAVLDYKRRR